MLNQDEDGMACLTAGPAVDKLLVLAMIARMQARQLTQANKVRDRYHEQTRAQTERSRNLKVNALALPRQSMET